MRTRLRFSVQRAIGALGWAVTVVAVAWWALSFGEVYAHDYITLREALSCSVVDSEICRLATSLCRSRHALTVAAYNSATLWAGAALLLGSLATGASSPDHAGARREGPSRARDR